MAPPKTIQDTIAGGPGQHHKIEGVVVAIVAGLESSQATAGGRVQVSFPWLDSGMQVWAQVAHPPGTALKYEVGDSVVVAFEFGDISFPVVLGRLG